MRGLVLCVAFCSATACTKQNPAAVCHDGTCIDPAHPYCDADGAIGGEPGTCIAVTCTPGSVGACEDSNSGLICNAAGNGYTQMPCAIGCDQSTLTCTMTCTTNAQCSSGVCKADGTCATDSEITFTSPDGGTLTDCSRAAPCSLDRALQLSVPAEGQYILLAAGAYSNPATETITGKRTLAGTGAATTTIRNAETGPIFVIDAGADVTFESLEIADALGIGSNRSNAYGISIPNSPVGLRSVRVYDSTFVGNGIPGGTDGYALGGGPGTVDIERSIFDGNQTGVFLSYSDVTIDRCTFSSNPDYGVYVVAGTLSITNSFIVQNGDGLWADSPDPAMLAFDTIADNSAHGVTCMYSTSQTTISLANTIVARNVTNTNGTPACDYSTSMIASDVAAFNFVNAMNPPYDYHIGSGSVAVDAASNCNVDHDVDGDARPKGSACDVGADEAF